MRYFFGLLILLIGLACKEKEQVIEVDRRMLNVLADIHFAESAASMYPKLQKDSLIKVYYNQVFEIHEISEDSFNLWIDAIQANPKEAELLYEKLTEEIKKKSSRVKGKADSKKKK